MKKALFFFSILILFIACKKDAGLGGNSAIRGRIKKDIRVVLTNPITYQYTLSAADQDVYIIYGNHISPDDRVWTNYKGEYEFQNLREGSYTIYVYSKDTTGVSGVDPNKMVVKQVVEINDRKQTVEASDMTIYDLP